MIAVSRGLNPTEVITNKSSYNKVEEQDDEEEEEEDEEFDDEDEDEDDEMEEEEERAYINENQEFDD